MSAEPNDDGDSQPQLLPDGEGFIYSGSRVKKNDQLLLLMAFVLRFKLPAAACQALLALFNVILPGCIPATNYLVDKVFGFDSRSVLLHYFCPNAACMNYFGPSVPEKCDSCSTVYNSNPDLCANSFMFVLPLADQLQSIFKKDSQTFESIFSDKSTSGELSDVYDGKLYNKQRAGANVTLQFNCDGAPIFTSSRFSIWPLLCAINELPTALRNCNVMLHSLWFGHMKPCVTTFLQPFISEINDLYNTGIEFTTLTGEVCRIFVSATLCICDAPARAMVQDFIQFNGMFGCGFCYHPGTRTNKGGGTVQVYPMNDLYPLRSHHKTVQHAEQAQTLMKPVKGVKGASICALLPNFDVVQSFTPDYMHCVLLGVTRQFVNLWTDSCNHKQPYYIKNLSAVDKLLKSIKPPDEICRLPRTLLDRKFWKASEFKSLLLIYSPVILMHILPNRYYRHWLLLCNGIRLLIQETITSSMIIKSRNCLHKFITLVPDLYGLSCVSYNIHILCHLPDAVQNWGPLWSHSAFVYEDIIGVLKKMYHGTQLVPKQVFKYFSAWNKLQSFSCLLLTSEEEVVDMYRNLSSSKCVFNAVQCRNFVGLRKSVDLVTRVSNSDRELMCNLLHFDDSVDIKFQLFDRFLLNRVVFSTVSYSQRFRRNNSFILLRNGCFADINRCFTVVHCICGLSACVCSKHVVLIVSCYLSSPVQSRFDSYVGIDLTQFMRRIVRTECETLAITPSDVVSK